MITLDDISLSIGKQYYVIIDIDLSYNDYEAILDGFDESDPEVIINYTDNEVILFVLYKVM